MSLSLLKKLGAVAGILLVLLVVYFYEQVPHTQAPFANAVDQAASIRLMRGDHGVELNKTNGVWFVQKPAEKTPNVAATPDRWPASVETVKTFLDGVKALQLEQVISNRPERQIDFEVDPSSGLRVVMMGPSSVLADGVFGKQAPDTSHIYFKYYDRPEIYMGRGLLREELGGADLVRWRSRQLIDIPETKIQAITMEGPGFKTELVRASTEVWTLGGEKVETGPVNALVGTLAHLHCNDFIDPVAYPTLTFDRLTYGRVIVKSADTTVEIKIGPEDTKSKQFPVSIAPAWGLAWLPESLIHSLQQKPSAFKKTQ